MSSAAVRLVFFDVGGTLVTAPSFAAMLTVCLDRLGVAVDRFRLDGAIAGWRHRLETESSARDAPPSREGDRSWWREAVEGVLGACGLPPARRREGGRLFLEINGAAEGLRVYPDAAPCLRRLRAHGWPLAVLSNWSWDLPQSLDALGWAGFFDPVVVSSRVGWRKPHRAIFDHAAALCPVPPHELLLVGDRLDADVEAALAAGWQAVLLDRDGRRGPAAPPGVPVLRGLDELPGLLGDAELPEPFDGTSEE